jgi:hypothetical protein
MKKSLCIVLVVLFCMSCGAGDKDMTKGEESLGNDIFRALLYPFRSGRLSNQTGDKKLAKDLYNAVYSRRVEWAQEILANGADPNYCRGESGWADANPLNVLSEGFYYTYYQRRNGEAIPDPAPDVAVLRLLLEAGADINRRPYIWNRVFIRNNKDFDQIISQRKVDNESLAPDAVQEQIDCFVSDANRLLEAFLKAGADPDKLGHPYPFSIEAMHTRITDEQANEYFSQGSRAINAAIEKGIMWESQVDLLLQYTNLDEESLKAAERSNDQKMIEKIQELWNKQ